MSAVTLHHTDAANRGYSLHIAVKLLLFTTLVVNGAAAQADWLSPLKNMFGNDSELVIWQAPGQYVMVVDQDWLRHHKHPPKNSHPAKVNQREIAISLASLQVMDQGNKVPVFTTNEVTLLAGKLVEALDKTHRDQDVVFAVVDQHQGRLLSTAGRVFILNGKLNVILGDVLEPADKNPDSEHISFYNAPHRAGKRWEPIDSSLKIITGNGIAYQRNTTTTRNDWVVIDIPAVVAAYKGPHIPVAETPPAQAGTMPPDKASQLLQERREMLEEMARLKKELEEKDAAAAVTAAPAEEIKKIPGGGVADISLENRLMLLKSLHEKKLITDAEYESKKKEILGDL